MGRAPLRPKKTNASVRSRMPTTTVPYRSARDVLKRLILVSCPSGSWHKSRSAAPGWLIAKERQPHEHDRQVIVRDERHRHAERTEAERAGDCDLPLISVQDDERQQDGNEDPLFHEL